MGEVPLFADEDSLVVVDARESSKYAIQWCHAQKSVAVVPRSEGFCTSSYTKVHDNSTPHVFCEVLLITSNDTSV